MNEQIDFWGDLLFKTKLFFEKEFVGKTKIRFFSVAIVVFCLGTGIDRVDTQLVKFDMRGNLDQIEFINNWLGYWGFSILIGAIGGYILYLIGGWFYNVRVTWSGGTGNLDQSRNIYVYSNFFNLLIIILISIFETLKNTIPYDPMLELEISDLVTSLFLLFFLFHSIYLSFTGVTTVTNVDVGKARIWFVLLPILIYLISFGALFMIFMSYFEY